MTHLPKRLLLLGALLCTGAVAQPAAAQVQPAGSGEPLYTSSQQNKQFFEWPATSGIDGYRVQFSYYENGTLRADPTYDAPNGASNYWADWDGVRALAHGSTYGICAQGRYSFVNDPLYFPDGPNSCSMGTMLGRRTHTTIDRSKPAASVALAGGAAYTKDPKIGIQVGFSDDVAGPFPANFMCFQFGGSSNICDGSAGFSYDYNPACSVPANGGKSTSFNCTADFGAGASPAPDGPVWACVIAADASIPDNPSHPNQSQSADKANLSDAKCDGVVLDRTAPQVSIAPSATSVKTGDLVSFAAEAADAGSGLGSGYEWSFGDSTGAGSGQSVTHTFTQAGTYEVRVKTADAAGNPATATKVITVSAPSTGGGSAGGGGPTGGGGSAGGGGTTTSTTTIREIVRQAGGAGGTTAREVGGLQVVAPRKVKLARAKALPLALTADTAGRASFALVRSGRRLARGGKAIAGAGTVSYRLKLPRKAKAGRYLLKVTFVPAAGRATTSTLKVALVGKARKARRARASAAGLRAPRVSGAGAPVALPDGKFHGKVKRSFAPRVLAG
jgi:PKD repeat protein